jgi:protoheme IX farnesyltransferase
MRDYLALCKPRISIMVMATSAMGFALAGGGSHFTLWAMVVGVGLSSAACGCLNQVIEQEPDGLMRRTAKRPLPAGRVSSSNALGFGIFLAVAGLCLLTLVGELPFLITALTIALYVMAYTPLKRVTPHTTWIGAAAGATSPMIGWAASRGHLDIGAWVLFAIQFLWQIPHFLAMFWIHREDYARAGFKVMPVVNPKATAAQIALHSFTLLPAAVMPTLCGMAGVGYGVGALCLSTAYLGVGLRASWTMTTTDTRRLFLASLAYLPILFGLMLWAS